MADERVVGVTTMPDTHDQADDEDTDDDAQIQGDSGTIDTNGYLTNRELGEE